MKAGWSGRNRFRLAGNKQSALPYLRAIRVEEVFLLPHQRLEMIMAE